MSLSPSQRFWQRFQYCRRAYVSLWIMCVMVLLSLGAELVSNDKPWLVYYKGELYLPLIFEYNETVFGGDFNTPTDYLDPFIKDQFAKSGNFAIYALNPYSYNTINYFAGSPNPAPPSPMNILGTDDRGRDILARLLYGFRVSMLFACVLTLAGVVLGVLFGAIQGFFGGYLDLLLQRVLEIWSSLPELYLLIILSSLFTPSLWLLLLILTAFGWMGLSDYVRAEFFRNRQMEYVLAARAMGLGYWQIMWKHVLPNSLTPVVAFLPFRISGAILALTSLDFLGLGVPSSTSSLGELLAQGKDNLDAWWIALPTFILLTGTLLLLIFIGEGARVAMGTDRVGK